MESNKRKDLSIVEPPGLKTISACSTLESHYFLGSHFERLKEEIAMGLVKELLKQDLIEFQVIENQPYRKEVTAKLKVYNPHWELKIMI